MNDDPANMKRLARSIMRSEEARKFRGGGGLHFALLFVWQHLALYLAMAAVTGKPERGGRWSSMKVIPQNLDCCC